MLNKVALAPPNKKLNSPSTGPVTAVKIGVAADPTVETRLTTTFLSISGIWFNVPVNTWATPTTNITGLRGPVAGTGGGDSVGSGGEEGHPTGSGETLQSPRGESMVGIMALAAGKERKIEMERRAKATRVVEKLWDFILQISFDIVTKFVLCSTTNTTHAIL